MATDAYGDGPYDISAANHRADLFHPRNRPLLLLTAGIILIALVAVIIAVSSGGAQLFPVSVKGKIGYIRPSGKLEIHPRFADAGNFEEGLAPVFDGKAWGN